MKLSNSENDISFDIDTNKENNTNADTQDLLCAHPLGNASPSSVHQPHDATSLCSCLARNKRVCEFEEKYDTWDIIVA